DASERFRTAFEIERLRAAVDGEQIVATFGALSTRIAVPGNVLPVAATSVVTVLATHRRQGVLRSLMTEHLAELHQNGEPLAALWSSESSIYGRFGYGPACERAIVKLDKAHARMREPIDIRGTMRLVEREQAQERFPAIYSEVAPHRPGLLERNADWWQYRTLGDPEYLRRGTTAHRRVLHVRDGIPAGYALYRTRADWERGTMEVKVIEVIGIDPPAEKALWQYLFGIDLATSIDCWNQRIDDPLRWWLEQPRRLERKVEDGLWLRPVDVAFALSGRKYSCAGSLALRIRDPLCPWNDGVWSLEVDQQGNGQCERTGAKPTLELTPDTLGMVYLGGHRFATLARSGLISGSPEAIRQADGMFTWDPMPSSPEYF
ncbi:MAG TPA: GNAT family N-acetyltransferase, partial [Planctomycetaceae bacterium]|nr:GNAT family N-acetyltransferase [Planctomycetaceae bacterium]